MSAGNADSAASREALEKLCTTYWFPLYAFVRRQGMDAHRAADLTQGFFASLLERDDLAKLDQARGKFRSFLLASIKNYMLNEIDRENAIKRGGGVTIVSIDARLADSRYSNDPVFSQTPERVFDRQWALALLDRVRATLRAEFAERGKDDQFKYLSGCLTGQPASGRYRQLGQELGLSESAVKVIVYRMKQRFGEILRDEIAHTVASEAEIDTEIQTLFNALRG